MKFRLRSLLIFVTLVAVFFWWLGPNKNWGPRFYFCFAPRGFYSIAAYNYNEATVFQIWPSDDVSAKGHVIYHHPYALVYTKGKLKWQWAVVEWRDANGVLIFSGTEQSGWPTSLVSGDQWGINAIIPWH
jgi:hypothetical protein